MYLYGCAADPIKMEYWKINHAVWKKVQRAKKRGVTYKAISELTGIRYDRVRAPCELTYPLSEQEIAAIDNAIKKLLRRR